MLSRNLEKTLHRALALANDHGHEYATLEHLLLALTDDQDAMAVLRSCGISLEPGDSVPVEELAQRAGELYQRWGSPLVVTRGDRGCFVFSSDVVWQIFGVQLPGRIDPVGAGDTFVAALAAILAWMLAGKLSRPLLQLADAAEGLRRGRQVLALDQGGQIGGVARPRHAAQFGLTRAEVRARPDRRRHPRIRLSYRSSAPTYMA